jgi:AcrR family transcriptional regulator
METDTPLRRDAAVNRQRILDAALLLFAEHGLDVSMDEVARNAGVGAGTLYRRFPTKEALLDAILAEGLERFHELAALALQESDGFAGLELFLERTLRLQLQNRALLEVLTLRLQEEPRLAQGRARIRSLIEQLVARAQAQGTLRADVGAADIQVLLWQLGRVVETTEGCRGDLWRRYLGLALDGLRASAAHPLPRPPASSAQLDKAMALTAQRRGLHRSR